MDNHQEYNDLVPKYWKKTVWQLQEHFKVIRTFVKTINTIQTF